MLITYREWNSTRKVVYEVPVLRIQGKGENLKITLI